MSYIRVNVAVTCISTAIRVFISLEGISRKKSKSSAPNLNTTHLSNSQNITTAKTVYDSANLNLLLLQIKPIFNNLQGLKTSNFIKAVSDTVLDMINAVYHYKNF